MSDPRGELSPIEELEHVREVLLRQRRACPRPVRALLQRIDGYLARQQARAARSPERSPALRERAR